MVFCQCYYCQLLVVIVSIVFFVFACRNSLTHARTHARTLIITPRCEALFESLSPQALSAASGPADSWECLDVGVSLFEEQDPFWWRRSHPEDEEDRAQSLAEEMERRRLLAGGDSGDGDGDYDGTRRDGLWQQRMATPDTPEAAEGRGGYTDLEVLEVLEPARAARIRLRQARCVRAQSVHSTQHKRVRYIFFCFLFFFSDLGSRRRTIK